MSIRTSTINKYLQAAMTLRSHLMDDPYVDTSTFTLGFNIAGNFLTNLIRAGFLARIGPSKYFWTHKPLNVHSISAMLEQDQDTKYERTKVRRTPKAKNTAVANDCGTMAQEPIDFTASRIPAPMAMDGSFGFGGPVTSIREVDPVNVTRSEYTALQERVASLEQLVIRKGVA